jgi:hypothetical protein
MISPARPAVLHCDMASAHSRAAVTRPVPHTRTGPFLFSATLRHAPQRFAPQRNDFLSIFRTNLSLPAHRSATHRNATLRDTSQRNELFFTFQISNDSARNYSNRYEAGVICCPPARRTGAVSLGVKPRPLPLHEINHSAHAVSLSSLARTCEPKRSLFRVFGKEFHDRRAC